MIKYKTSKIKAKKRFGQNFLVDSNKKKEIIDSLRREEDFFCLEVGPGYGALTFDLSKIFKELLAVEIDKEAFSFLVANKELHDVKILNEDFLDFDFSFLKKEKRKKIFISNLPYYIATPILFKVINSDIFDSINFMIQKELADRIFAKPNSKQYGRLSVTVQTFFTLSNRINVPKNCFNPVPKVDSVFVSLSRNNCKIPIEEFQEFIKQCFAQKRKTLLNSLKQNEKLSNDVKGWLEKENKPLNIRAEQVSIEEFKNCYTYINNGKNKSPRKNKK